MVLNILVKYMKKNKNKNKLESIVIIFLIIIISVIAPNLGFEQENQTENIANNSKISYEVSEIPPYTGEIYIEINNNTPKFTTEDMSIEEDYYSERANKKVRNGNDKN